MWNLAIACRTTTTTYLEQNHWLTMFEALYFLCFFCSKTRPPWKNSSCGGGSRLLCPQYRNSLLATYSYPSNTRYDSSLHGHSVRFRGMFFFPQSLSWSSLPWTVRCRYQTADAKVYASGFNGVASNAGEPCRFGWIGNWVGSEKVRRLGFFT